MCTPDVLSAVVSPFSAVANAVLPAIFGGPKKEPGPAAPDPAAERAKAEADAANAANANVAADRRARRANTLALGGQSDTMGATQSAVTNTAKTSVLGGGAA